MKAKPSALWDHFKKIPGTTTAKCTLCKKKYSYKTSITNLKRHLKYKHLSAYKNCLNAVHTRSINIELVEEGSSSSAQQDIFQDLPVNQTVQPDDNKTTPRLSESCLTDYSVPKSQEFSIHLQSSDRTQQREDELQKLRIAEREWVVKAAKENFIKAKAEREALEELVLCNRAKREEAELRLAIFRNDKHIIYY